jgi:glyoxylase-like metal-dependent hydrolase (beta-lactamase superfamily II)
MRIDNPFSSMSVGVRGLSVPTPFTVGPVNLWLIEDDPLTLVDTGADWATGLLALERGLRDAGYSLTDIERIVLTHHHPDHCGLTSVLAERSGATVHATLGVAEWLSRYEAVAADHATHQLEIFVQHGLPQQVATALRETERVARHWIAPARVDTIIEDGSVLESARSRWTVHHRPGHSHLDVVLHEEQGARRLIAGDHLLAHAPPIAIMSPKVDAWRRPRPMLDYVASLHATRAMEISAVLPGHGVLFEDVRTLIDRYIRRQELRSAQVLKLLADGPRTAFALALAVWESRAAAHVTLSLSDTLGSLDLLAERGRVHEVDRDGLIAFAAT